MYNHLFSSIFTSCMKDDYRIHSNNKVNLIFFPNFYPDLNTSINTDEKYHVAFIASLKWTIYVYDYAETSPNFYWRIYYKINEICQ
jgi:hypothetical protein